MPVTHSLDGVGQIQIAAVLHHDLGGVVHALNCGHVGHNAVHECLCLLFQRGQAVAHVDFRAVGQIIQPINVGGFHQFAVVVHERFRLLSHNARGHIRDFLLQFGICLLERCRHALPVDLLKGIVGFKDFALDGRALGFVLLEFLGKLGAGIFDALIGFFGADQRGGFGGAPLNVGLYAVKPLDNDRQLLKFNDLQCGILCHIALSFQFLNTS